MITETKKNEEKQLHGYFKRQTVKNAHDMANRKLQDLYLKLHKRQNKTTDVGYVQKDMKRSIT